MHGSNAAQLIVVLLGAFALKHYYSTAGVNQLRWILAPTTAVVELLTGLRFEFESHAGYMSSDRSFVIAASCAGVNFLITAFLMLSLRKFWSRRGCSWRFIPVAGLIAYLATIVANTVRIATALQLKQLRIEFAGLSGNQLHRLEGIFVYFGFLMLLFVLSEKIRWTSGADSAVENAEGSTSEFSRTTSIDAGNTALAFGLLRSSFFPLLIYYATTLGIPIATAAYRSGSLPSDFWEHFAFVFLAPLIFILPLATYQHVIRKRRVRRARRNDDAPADFGMRTTAETS